MSEFTPNLATIESAYVNWALLADRGIDASEAAAEFDRFIAKVKADALREAAIQVTTQVENAAADETGDPGPYYHGASYGMCKTAHWLHRRADRIEGEA